MGRNNYAIGRKKMNPMNPGIPRSCGKGQNKDVGCGEAEAAPGKLVVALHAVEEHPVAQPVCETIEVSHLIVRHWEKNVRGMHRLEEIAAAIRRDMP